MVTMTEQFTSGQTVSWKHDRIGRGSIEKPKSFAECLRMRFMAGPTGRIPNYGFADAIIVLLESTEYSFSVLKSSSGTRVFRVWKALVTCRSPQQAQQVWTKNTSWSDPTGDLSVNFWSEEFETPFYCWIREADLLPNPEVINSDRRLLNRLQELYLERKQKTSSSLKKD